MDKRVKTKVGTRTNDGWAAERRVLLIITAVFAVLLLLGTFLDLPLAKVLYSPKNVIATWITTIGIYPFSASVVLFLGVQCERVAHTPRAKVAKNVLIAVIALVALFVGFVGAASLLDGDCLGSIIPAVKDNRIAALALSPFIEWPLFVVGWKLAARSDDKLLLKRTICLVLVLLAAFAFMQLGKGFFNRPRYRIVAEGLEGVGFVPWFRISPKPTDLIAQLGLDRNDFRSFPSGHALLSISTISILLSLTWLFPSLRNKRVQLCWIGFGFTVVIVFTRILLGAHYLSDVAAGALLGIAFVLLNHVLQQRIDKSA